ncbi:MAG: cation diffusion facilitator family transporter [Bacteroidia bacterium]
MESSKQNIKVQQLVTAVAVLLFILKIAAWNLTNSVAILTDALESSVNVITGFIGLYGLYLSSRPKDSNHPYGHGKIEFVTAAIEGTLILVAGLIIIYESLYNLNNPHEIVKLDIGILLITISAMVNYGVGLFAVKTGKKNNSLALIASGKHLMSDTYSTLGIIAGLFLVFISDYLWIDSLVALLFAFFIIFTGYRIIRQSVAGIMDEADKVLLGKLVALLNMERADTWIDLHNLRIIKYGSILHLDCHLTVPWYFNVNEAHKEIDTLENLVKTHFGHSLELFVHTDGCLEFSCKLCTLENCQVRQSNFINKMAWTVENISSNRKHQLI